MISVIVPVYKVEKYLRKCVESIQNQTYKDLEIILVDDGSPDNCGKICEELAERDQRILVIHQSNTGQAGARNAGLAECRGEYVAFVDSDDTIETDMYRTMLEAMEDGCDLVICGHRIVREREHPRKSKAFLSQRLTEDELWEEIFGKLNNAVWNKLYRREIISDLRFPVGMIHGEDLIFNLNYLSRCSMGMVNRTQFYNYLRREGSITTTKFNRKRLMEITSKDLAREIVERWKPEQLHNADKFCFRARMNILRSIFKAREEENYHKEVLTYKEYAMINYKEVKKGLRFKERREYVLLVYCMPIYKMLARRYQ